jgi:hypothetical protein
MTFRKSLDGLDPDDYINDCCVGGDRVTDHLLPMVRETYQDVRSLQEDWGWFIWFYEGDVHLAVDVYTDDSEALEFRVRLTSSRTRWLFFHTEIDLPELDRLRDRVRPLLEEWADGPVTVERVE